MAKRRTAWESTSTEELLQAEFLDRHGGIDLRPSVYVCEAGDAQAKRACVVQLRAEHAVSLMKSPNAAGPHVDFEGVTPRAPEFSEGTTRFSFANRTHHEVVLNDAAELRAMLDAVRTDVAERLLPVSRDEVLDYAATERRHQTGVEEARREISGSQGSPAVKGSLAVRAD